jgi:hypothetical protein
MEPTDGYPRSHPLDGSGLRAGLFQLLLRENAASASARVAVPDTVLFEHGYPRWWFLYDDKGAELRRSAGGKDLHAASILDYFLSKAPKVHGTLLGVVAIYTYAVDGSESGAVAVEYHTEESLKQFLVTSHDPRKKSGILQTVTVPLELFYTVVSVNWCPAVQIVRRRASKRMLSELRTAVLDRFVTFDGPEYLSTEVHCAVETREKVVAACGRIADHLSRSFHLKVSSMQCFFIIGKDGEPVLTWSGAFYAANDASLGPRLTMPHTLLAGPSFKPPIAGVVSTSGEDVNEQIAAADKLQHDIKASMSPRAADSAGRPDPSAEMNLSSGEFAAGSPATTAARQRRHKADAAARIADLAYSQWHLVSADVQGEYEALLECERTAILSMSHVLYAAHSQFQVTDMEFASVEIPADLARTLGSQDALAELLGVVGLNKTTDTLTHVVVAGPEQRKRSAISMHPLPKLIADAEAWILEFFGEQRRLLRLRCVPAIESAVVRAVTAHFVQGLDEAEACAAVTWRRHAAPPRL